jgi:hypothetical protein
VLNVNLVVNMKKKAIPTAQMGRSNIQRRAYRSAGYTAPKADTKKAESKPAETKATPPAQAKPPVLLRPLLTPPPGWKQQKMYDDYMKTVQGESFNFSTKAKEEKKQAPAKKKIVRTESKAIDVPKREKPSLNIKTPATKGIDKGPEKRKFTDAQIKIMEVMKKGEKADGTMKEGAQRKIQAIRTKERMTTQKIRNKAERAEKKYEVKSAKAKVKAVRKSFKK